MKQSIFSLKDRFFIKDETGYDKYNVQGEFFSLGKKLHIYDNNNNEVALIQQKLLTFMPRYTIEIYGEREYEIVKEVTLFKPRFRLEGTSWRLEGDFLSHDYFIETPTNRIMNLEKHWFTWGDSYELDVYKPQDELLCLCIALTVDCILFSGSK